MCTVANLQGARDVKDANEALMREVAERRQAEELFRALLESAPDAVIIVDQSGAIVLINAVAEQLFGYTREELVGQSVETIVPQRMRDRHREHRQQFHSRPHARPMGAGVELIGLRKDGSEFPAEISLGPLETEERKLIISVIRDVTERKRAAAERRNREVQLIAAQRIQQHLLPKAPPSLPGFDIAGALYPMEFAAGDHFDYLTMADGSVGIVVGDVAGHGFASALLMASTRALLRSHVQNGSDAGQILQRTNGVLCREMEVDRFVTMIFARLDPQQRSLSYASAGHPTGHVIGPSGKAKSCLESTSLPLGVLAETEFPTIGPVPLDDGDVVLMLTDGALDVPSPAGDAFGPERAIAVVHENRSRPAREIVDNLYRAIRDFGDHQPPVDDVTLVVIKVGA
jgi:sigma-B regulation protein RsbU (phosphoserine phosphatase)